MYRHETYHSHDIWSRYEKCSTINGELVVFTPRRRSVPSIELRLHCGVWVNWGPVEGPWGGEWGGVGCGDQGVGVFKCCEQPTKPTLIAQSSTSNNTEQSHTALVFPRSTTMARPECTDGWSTSQRSGCRSCCAWWSDVITRSLRADNPAHRKHAHIHS